MSAVLARIALREYDKYEHQIHTRSEVLRDWAVHGPLARWAAELMQVDSVRLYNTIKRYSAGSDGSGGCTTQWHRDTIAVPFPTSARSVTFNVYLDDIGADGPRGDALVYSRGSHRNLASPPGDWDADATTQEDAYEPRPAASRGRGRARRARVPHPLRARVLEAPVGPVPLRRVPNVLPLRCRTAGRTARCRGRSRTARGWRRTGSPRASPSPGRGTPRPTRGRWGGSTCPSGGRRGACRGCCRSLRGRWTLCAI